MIGLKLDTVVEENGKYIVYVRAFEKATDVTVDTFSVQYQDNADLKRKLKPKLVALEEKYTKVDFLKIKIAQALVELEEEVTEDVAGLDTE